MTKPGAEGMIHAGLDQEVKTLNKITEEIATLLDERQRIIKRIQEIGISLNAQVETAIKETKYPIPVPTEPSNERR